MREIPVLFPCGRLPTELWRYCDELLTHLAGSSRRDYDAPATTFRAFCRYVAASRRVADGFRLIAVVSRAEPGDVMDARDALEQALLRQTTCGHIQWIVCMSVHELTIFRRHVNSQNLTGEPARGLIWEDPAGREYLVVTPAATNFDGLCETVERLGVLNKP